MDPDLAEILRVHPEPCARVSDAEVHRGLGADPAGYLAHLERVLREIAGGEADLEHPAKLVFDDGPGAGDFRVMPCVVRRPGRPATKTVKVVGTNVTETRVPDQVTVGRALRLDPDDNFVTHLFDACLLSSARTGACGVLGLRRLATGPVRRLGVLGAGRVGYYTALYAVAGAGVEEVRVADRRPARAEGVARALAKRTPGADVSAVGDLASADRLAALDGDAVVLATTSAEPVCGPGDLEAPVVVSLGADTDDQRELEAGWAEAADLYVDTGDSLAIGDLRAWREAGLVSAGDVTDLLELIREGADEGSEERHGRRVFVSTGAALFDNLTIGYLLAGNRRGATGRS